MYVCLMIYPVRSQVLDRDLDQGHFQELDPDPVQFGKELRCSQFFYLSENYYALPGGSQCCEPVLG